MTQASANIALAAVQHKGAPETVGDTRLVIPAQDEEGVIAHAMQRAERTAAARDAKHAPARKQPARQAAAVTRLPEGRNTNQPFTLERAKAACPSSDRMVKIQAFTGLDTPEAADLLEKTEMHFAQLGQFYEAELGQGSEVAVSILMQGLTQELVTRACLAGEMYETKLREAINEHSKLRNPDRDEDRGGAAGFESRLMGKYEFAGKIGRQAWALTAMAEGAVSAFAHVTGDEWKPRASRTSVPLAERSLDAVRNLMAGD